MHCTRVAQHGAQRILEHNRLDLGNVLGNDQVLPGCWDVAHGLGGHLFQKAQDLSECVSPMVALTNLHVSANFSELDTLAFGMNFCKYCLAWTGFGLDFD